MMGDQIHAAADVIPAALEVKTVQCKACGNEVEFKGKQWRKPCGRCGMVLTLQKFFIEEREKAESAPRCFICMDKGLVLYKEQHGEYVYDHVARCYCKAGRERREQGIPQVDEVDNICDLRYLEMKNRKEWEKRTGRKAEAALVAQAEEVDPAQAPFVGTTTS